MANYAVDFALDVMPDTGEDIEVRFRFGKCENFRKTLKWVKRIPYEEREYDPEENHLWRVKASEENLRLLCLAFDNFRDCYDLAKRQMSLPGM